MQRFFMAALAGFVCLTGGAAPAAAASSSAGLPIGALTPLWRIGEAIAKSDIDPTLQSGPFDPNAPRPLAVAVAPPSLLSPGEVADTAGKEDLPRLDIPETEDAGEADTPTVTILRPRRKPPVPARVAEAPEKPAAGAPAKPAPNLVALTAAPYGRFMNDIVQISKMRLDDPKNLNRATQMFLDHDPVGIAHGLVAKGAEVAVESKAFKSGLKDVGKRRGGVKGFFENLKSKPNDVHAVKGADVAQKDILISVATDVAMMRQLSHRLLEVAYERTGDEARMAAEAGNGGLTLASLQSSGAAPTVPARAGAYGWPLVTQMLTLGAHIGIEDPETEPAGATLFNNKKNDQCLKWAKLNLDQCIAAARLNSEKAFCLSKHALDERADCLAVTLR